MRSIYYTSDGHGDLFPQNSQTNFESFIYISDLNYISPDENIEACVKTIVFEYDLHNKLPHALGLKTNLCEYIISSCGWDTIVATFVVNPNSRVIRLEFSNPTFFLTNREKLSKSVFTIIDLKTGKQPNFSGGHPTFIEVGVRSRITNMKPSFHMILDSSCQKSLQSFPENGNMDFTIQLPQQMVFQKNWSVCVKSIHFSNTFLQTRVLEILVYRYNEAGLSHKEIVVYSNKYLHLRMSTLTEKMNRANLHGIKFSYSEETGKIKITNTDKDEFYKLTFSEDFVKLLGLEGPDVVLDRDNTTHDGKYNVYRYGLHPQHYVVRSDVVEDCILSGQYARVLKYFTHEPSADPTVDKHFPNNDFVTLSSKNFDRIRIRITDLEGKTIQCDPDIPTRMQLLFFNA